MSEKKTEVTDFLKGIDTDLEGYWTARRAVTGDDLAVCLEMAGHLIKKLDARVGELEDELSIWRSFMVPEPVVREAAQEPVCASREDIRQAVRDVSREAGE